MNSTNIYLIKFCGKGLTNVNLFAIITYVVFDIAIYGEMSEWLKEPVLKTGNGSAVRGFESRSLLQFVPVLTGAGIFILTKGEML